MALNQAETFEWLRNRVQELEAENESLRARVESVRRETWKAAIEEAKEFANEDLSNSNVIVLIEQHLKPRAAAAEGSKSPHRCPNC